MRRGRDRPSTATEGPGGACPRTRRSDTAGANGLGRATAAAMEPIERPTGAVLFANVIAVPVWS